MKLQDYGRVSAYAVAMAADGAELVIGLVSPVGMDTGGLAEALRGALADCNYSAVIIKLSDLLPADGAPYVGETEDQRIRRLIETGNNFCTAHGDAAAIARLAVQSIREHRIALLRHDDDRRPVSDITSGRPRTAYILRSLKRPGEVQLLRKIYGPQFVLIGSQSSLEKRKDALMGRNLSTSTPSEKERIVEDLIGIDAEDRDLLGQNVTNTYPQADFFIADNDRDQINRVTSLLFGAPKRPSIGEFAMYVALTTRARSLAASRKVGASIVVGDAVIATGFNDVPHGQTPDVLQGTDTSEKYKRDSLRDTMQRLREHGLLAGANVDEDEAVDRAVAALKGGELLSVIEYQRAVHAEARAIDDATIRGVSPKGGTLYVTTYPCHLCYKHALSVRIDRVEYIDPYPKSRAVRMFSENVDTILVPFSGVAPRRYMSIFDDRPAFKADAHGKFPLHEPSVAQPLLGTLRDNEDISESERAATRFLTEETT